MTEETVDDRAGPPADAASDRGSFRDWIALYLKGLAMGAADTVPGVSGGTIALVVGVYERLITALAGLDPRLLADLRGVHTAGGRRRARRVLRDADLAFLVVLGLGAITSVVVLSRFLHAAATDHPGPTYAFFFGLIGASAVVLYGELEFGGPRPAVGALAGLVVGFVVAAPTEGGSVEPALPVVFVTGVVAITAMILPGVSGAFILLLLGQYEYLTEVLTEFVDAVIALVVGGDTSGLLEGGTVIATATVGAVVGLLTVARAIRWALDRQRAATLAFLVSLMVGSLRLPIAEVTRAVGDWTPIAAATVGLPAVVGAVGVLALDRYTDDLDLDAAGGASGGATTGERVSSDR